MPLRTGALGFLVAMSLTLLVRHAGQITAHLHHVLSGGSALLEACGLRAVRLAGGLLGMGTQCRHRVFLHHYPFQEIVTVPVCPDATK